MPYPTTPKFSAVGMESVDPTLFSVTTSGRQQSRKTGNQKWKFTASYPPLTRTEFAPVWAFLLSQSGRHGIFTIVLPELSATSGTSTGTISASASVVGDSSISVTGSNIDLKAGDFIKFSGHDKVYALTADRSGNGSMAIAPALIYAVTTDTVIYTNVPFTVRMSNDIQSYKVGKDMLFSNEVDMMEAI